MAEVVNEVEIDRWRARGARRVVAHRRRRCAGPPGVARKLDVAAPRAARLGHAQRADAADQAGRLHPAAGRLGGGRARRAGCPGGRARADCRAGAARRPRPVRPRRCSMPRRCRAAGRRPARRRRVPRPRVRLHGRPGGAALALSGGHRPGRVAPARDPVRPGPSPAGLPDPAGVGADGGGRGHPRRRRGRRRRRAVLLHDGHGGARSRHHRPPFRWRDERAVELAA